MAGQRTLIETGTPGWYEDPENPGKKVRKRNGDQILSLSAWDEMRKKARAASHAPVVLADTGKVLTGKTTVIKCADCGAERTIKVQDAFQVKRCAEHQRQHRLRRRRERTAERAAARKAAKA